MQKERIRIVNNFSPNVKGEYVLYWMQAYRRLEYNHSLDFAVSLAEQYKKPLVVYEGLRMDYPWNSTRIHRFILEGMENNFFEAEEKGFTYWSFVETSKNPARGVLKSICEKAVAVVTDDFPCFIIPEQTTKLANKILVPLYSIDGNGVIPLKLYGEFASAARILRPRIHKLFPESFRHISNKNPSIKNLPSWKKTPPLPTWNPRTKSINEILNEISFQNQVSVVPTKGGRKQALILLEEFLSKKILHYEEGRSNPHSPQVSPVSGLSAYIHFGYISIDEIVSSVLNLNSKENWSIENLNLSQIGKKEFFHNNPSIYGFLDELLTWRDIGYLMFFLEPSFRKDLSILPDWLKKNNLKHKEDKREYLYTKLQLENFVTHDKLWNLAQKELVFTGKMHNYMRMLWGKKVIEWTSSLEEAFEILEDFNNKYALDGRNPNSYTGILWCFGLFDRPWFPERNIFGNIRYMSTDAALRKFQMQEYIDYVEGLSHETLF